MPSRPRPSSPSRRALVGYFLVLRGQTFAGHALSHVGFAGATGAVLMGVSPLLGLLAATVLAGAGMGFLGERFQHRDVAIGIVLAMSLGCGLLFLHFFTAYATQATALLFGNVLGVEAPTVLALLALGIITIGALASISRPLLFATLQPELAEAKGVSLRRLSVLFLVIVALGDRGVGADRRHPPCLHAHGRAGGGGATGHDQALAWAPAFGCARLARSVARADARFLHRLADELLDHRVGRCHLCARALESEECAGASA